MKRQILSIIVLCLLTAGWATAGFTDWTYKRLITLSTATITNNYQVKVVLTTSTFNYAPCEAGGNDLRFEDASTLLSLPYWIESWNSSGTSIVWVAVANSGTTTFNLYYGKSGAAAASSGTNTFDFFDDFNSGNAANWIARTSNGVVTLTGGYMQIGGGNTVAPHGHTAMASRYYAGFTNGIIEGSIYLSADAIAEVGFRDAPGGNGTGYKSRMDGRASGGGISHLKPPYANWTQFDGQTTTPVGTLAWKTFKITVNGVAMTVAVDNQTRTSTDAAYAGPGEISLQNHYGSYTRYDNIRVRNYAATEPTATIGAEQPVATGIPIINNSIGATNIWADSAWLNGVLVSTGTSDTVWGVLWGTNNPGTTRDGWSGGNSVVLGVAGGNNLTNTTQATGLAENTTYYYAYWATNATGTNVATATSFTTKGGPSVDNGTGASGIGIGTATLNGNLLSTGGLSTEVYVYWGPDTNYWANTNYLGSKSVGAFSVPVSNLYYGVRYYYRCYAVNPYAGRWAADATNFLSLSPAGLATWPTGWRTNAWTGDADSGINSTYIYLVKVQPHASAGSVTINDVTFTGNGRTGPNHTISGIASDHGPNTPNITGNSFNMAKYFSYGGSPGIVAITNLIVGKRYLTTFYAYAFDTPGNRYQTFSVAGGTSCYVDQDFYGQLNGIRISYAFDATAPGNIFTITPASGTFHMSGLSVAQDPATKLALSVTNTGSSTAAPGAAIFNATVNATGSVFDVWAYWGPTDGTNNPNAWLGSTLVTTLTNATSANVSKTVAGLPPGTTFYTFRIINAATNYWATPSGSAVVEATADAPKIETRPATNVYTNRATLNGMLTSTGTSATVVSVYWGSNGDRILTGDWAFTNDFGVCTDLPFEGLAYATNVTDLIPGQEYTYRYYAANATTGVWGDAVSFVTWLIPTVDNGGGATVVGQTTATLNGTVLTGNPDPQAWIYWGTTDGGTDKGVWNRTALDRGEQAGAFSGNVSGLDANRTYYYRCYVSNACGEAWAPASASFTTLAPGVSINDSSVNEGAASLTTSMVFTVSLSAVSALDATVHFATANGTATTADNDYVAIADSLLTIPAGNLTGQITVTVNGDNRYEPNETLYVNLSTLGNVTNIDSLGLGTINNDDNTVYVRGDGQGSDSNSGGTWNSAWATLQKALDSVPFNYPIIACVQASTGSQSYATCSRYIAVPDSSLREVAISFLGGWQSVDATPVQTGVTRVMDPATNKPGFKLDGPHSYHGMPKKVLFDRFAFSNVTDGIYFLVPSGADASGVLLTVSNTTIHARNNGILIDYPKPYPPSPGAGGPARLTADNIDVVAGLGGSGDGVCIYGWWDGSRIGASGMDPVTGKARVSTITAPNGAGVTCSALNYSTPRLTLEKTVIYDCGGDAIRLSASQIGYNNAIGSNIVYAALSNCTITDNGGDGLHLISQTPGGWGNPTNSIFANNGGSGINLDGGAGVFTCSEGYNVFFNNGNTGIQVNGTPQSPAGSTSTADPLFRASGAKPAPWYWIGSRSSPAYKTASDNGIRGAYQNDPPPSGTVILIL